MKCFRPSSPLIYLTTKIFKILILKSPFYIINMLSSWLIDPKARGLLFGYALESGLFFQLEVKADSSFILRVQRFFLGINKHKR